MKHLETILQSDPLISMVQKDNFVGWIYSINYQSALVMTNDLWKYRSLGVPHNCFLIATAVDPAKPDSIHNDDKEVILLRVVGSAKLPSDDELIRTKIDLFQHQTSIDGTSGLGKKEYDDITLAKMQFGGLECRVLGTFYIHGGSLWLGSDIESFASAARLNVYRPRGAALTTITNYVDPIRKTKSVEDAKALGVKDAIEPFKIGSVRYTSTMRLHRQDESEEVAVSVQPTDFLARRTAVLGMTRTGKSNMIKQMVSVVRDIGEKGGLPIGQLIFDINGEYANANQQDQGAIATVFPDDTIKYRLTDTKGFRPLQNNFYAQMNEGHSFFKDIVKSTAGDIKQFLEMSFDEPPKERYDDLRNYSLKKAAYWGVLCRAGFATNDKLKTALSVSQGLMDSVAGEAIAAFNYELPNYIKNPGRAPYIYLSPKDAMIWFRSLRNLWRLEKKAEKPPPKSRAKKTELETSADESDEPKTLGAASKLIESSDELRLLINILDQKNNADGFIIGYGLLKEAAKYHTPARDTEVTGEIYKELTSGKIVIIDLSLGQPSVREKLVEDIAARIFQSSMNHFIAGENPPNIVLYIEEAHNLIGKNTDPNKTWPRIAKEGAKYRIALVYATQEVSSMHPNILANTENWFITHLNNKGEIKELAQFYDFADFGDSLIRAQDVGFARVKTLSSPYVIPTQIDKFEPTKFRKKVG
ncbi:MAG: ATP-binding protein [Pseudobdellovibrionaceae bacterium]